MQKSDWQKPQNHLLFEVVLYNLYLKNNPKYYMGINKEESKQNLRNKILIYI